MSKKKKKKKKKRYINKQIKLYRAPPYKNCTGPTI